MGDDSQVIACGIEDPDTAGASAVYVSFHILKVDNLDMSNLGILDIFHIFLLTACPSKIPLIALLHIMFAFELQLW